MTNSARPDRRTTRRWNDRLVVALLAIGLAGFAFAAGRYTVDPGPRSVQEAMQMAQAGELPFGEGGAPGGAGGFGGGVRGGGFPKAGEAPVAGGEPGREQSAPGNSNS